MTINRQFFFSYVRLHLLGGSLKQGQVDGMTAILDYWESKYAKKDDRWLAYLLGTAFHETAFKMQPIDEFGGSAYFNKRYSPSPTGKFPAIAKSLGNKLQDDGDRFHGRGFVQLTGRNNYTDWGNRLSIDLVGDPKLAKDLAVATRILVDGSILGTFTGRKLETYINATTADWINARRIINGTDKAANIAAYAKQFYAAISYTV